jgi:hypothetical protein
VTNTPLGQNIIHIDAGVNCNTFGTAVPEQLHRIELANNLEPQQDFRNLCCRQSMLYR